MHSCTKLYKSCTRVVRYTYNYCTTCRFVTPLSRGWPCLLQGHPRDKGVTKRQTCCTIIVRISYSSRSQTTFFAQNGRRHRTPMTRLERLEPGERRPYARKNPGSPTFLLNGQLCEESAAKIEQQLAYTEASKQRAGTRRAADPIVARERPTRNNPEIRRWRRPRFTTSTVR